MSVKKSYYEKLKDPRWQKKRLEILERDNFTCRGCNSKDKKLNVHHGFYDYSFKNPWDYHNHTMWTLCDDCHRKAHDYLHDIHMEISRINPLKMEKVFLAVHETRCKMGEDANHHTYDFESNKWIEK